LAIWMREQAILSSGKHTEKTKGCQKGKKKRR